MDDLVAVVVGLHFYDRVEDRVWGDRVVVIEMVIAGCLFVNVKPLWCVQVWAFCLFLQDTHGVFHSRRDSLSENFMSVLLTSLWKKEWDLCGVLVCSSVC
jgi:hypothetical protein